MSDFQSGEPGAYGDVPEAEYHAFDRLSSSMVKRLAAGIPPARVRHEQRNPKSSTAPMRVGSLLHTLVLEPHHLETRFFVFDGRNDKRTAEYKAASKEAGARDIIKTADLETAQAMASAIRSMSDATPMLASYRFEESILYTDRGVPMKARLDAHDRLPAAIWDVKTTAATLDDHTVSRTIANYGYDIQSVCYRRALAADLQRELGHYVDWTEIPFWLVFVEKDAPHLTRMVEIDANWTDRAWSAYCKALDAWKACMDTQVWSGYTPAQPLPPPSWRLIEEEDVA